MNICKLLPIAFAVVLATVSPAMAEPPPIEAYGQLPDVERASLSPSGKRYAMVATFKGKRALIIAEDGKVLRLSEIGEAKLRGLSWADEDTILLTSSGTVDLGYGFTTDKAEIYSSFLMPVTAQTPVRQVFADQRDILDATFGFYGIRTVEGERIAYFGGLRLKRTATGTRLGGYVFDHGRPALFAVNLSDMSVKNVENSPPEGHRRDWLVDAEGDVVATLDFAESDGDWTIRNRKNQLIAKGTNPTGGVWLMALGTEGNSVLFAREDPETEVNAWYEVPLDASSEAVEFLPDVATDDYFVDPETGRYTGYEGEDGKRVMISSSATSRFAAVQRAFPNLNVTVRNWTGDFGRMLVHTDGNKDSGTWFDVDLVGKTANAIAYERLAIGPDAVGPISTFAYTASDGLELDGILTLPPGVEPKNLPIVMFPHGGPHAHDLEGFDWWAQAFASRGYAVFQPNFRGSTNRDTAFMQAGYGEWGRKMQTDISDGLAALAEKGIVDPDRACIVGASYGGYAALAGVTVQQGLYRCSVAVAPVSDLSLKRRLNMREVGSSGRGLRGRILGDMLGPRSGFDEVSPVKLAERADAPILLIHGRDDTVVPFVHSEKMVDALDDADKPYRLVQLDEEDHWLSKGATRLQMLKEAIAFVQQHNPAN